MTAYESGSLQNEEIVAAFEKGLHKSCAEYIIAREPALNLFSGKLFEEKIRQFRQTNDYFEELVRREISARLAGKIPNFVQEASQSSELGILQRAIKSNGRGLSIRKLFEQIPNLLLRLAPCMLMSPISVAQYLDPKYAQFYLVVFDEASQMPTSEAVGALARGKNAIVVGDPKQLPPTSFFAANRVDEDNFATEDLESILDDCLALSMPETHLLWHYRSKHESLIAFSNMQYYKNKLLTFPSPNDLVSNVRLCLVDGVYDRGKTKQNKAEAQAVINEIVRRLQDPVLSKRSIGVVTFSSVQQNLIDDMLVEVFKENPELAPISKNLLCKRVLQSFGIGRMGARIEKAF